MKRSTMAVFLSLLIGLAPAQAQIGTGFTYQGRLVDAGLPGSGAYDFEFQLFTLSTGGVGSTTQFLDDVVVTNGLFTVRLDFGGAAFTGSPRFLETRVRPGVSTGAFTTLTTRQEMTPTPNAIFSTSAATATSAGTVSGTVGVLNGGTGQTTLATNGVVYGQGTSGVATAVGAAGQVLTGTAGAPAWSDSPSLGGNLNLVNPSTALAGNILKGGVRFIHNFGGANTFVGVAAGNFSTGGLSNTGIGNGALTAIVGGSDNTATGAGALSNNTTGSSNTATGAYALTANTAGSHNSGHGTGALSANTGSGNTASGSFALLNNTTGSFNSAVGASALRLNTTGGDNTATGFEALTANTTGSGNTAAGYHSLVANTTGSFNTATGRDTLAANTTGNENTAYGVAALTANTTGAFNTATGVYSLVANTSGSGNTGHGAGALSANSIGGGNSAVGSLALLNNTTAGRNTAIGADALKLQSFNNSGAAWDSGNTAVGHQALLNNQPTSITTGIENTAVGAGALSSNSTGRGNTAIGFGANVSPSTVSNATAIGMGALVDASNKIRLGNTAVTVIQGQVAYTFSSDRRQKENFREVDAQGVLEKLRSLDVTTWNYVGHEPSAFRHYGPMAQDFFAAFGHDEVGAIGSETTINSGDLSSVLMLGLKGLDAQVQDRIAAQAAEIATLKQQIAELTGLVKTLTQGASGARDLKE